MPQRCAAGGCSNTCHGGYMLHSWPKDPRIASQWTLFVKYTRLWDGPTRHSHLCSAHFEEDDYDYPNSIGIELGYRQRLKKLAVPKIFTMKTIESKPHSKVVDFTEKTQNSEFKKRGRKVVLQAVKTDIEDVETQIKTAPTKCLPCSGNNIKGRRRRVKKGANSSNKKTASIGIQCDFPETNHLSYFSLDQDYAADYIINVESEKQLAEKSSNIKVMVAS